MPTWFLKIAAKIALSRLPVRYDFWQKLGLFRFGKMDQSSYALKTFRLHMGLCYPGGLPANATVLEMGPGDSIAAALVARAHGAGKIYLADVGDFAVRDAAHYRAMATDLAKAGLTGVPDLSRAEDFDDILDACNAIYLTNGLEGLRSIPDGSVDFIWSHSVVEHIRKKDFGATFMETCRILKDGGQASHSVNLKDHLNEELNNLRFSEKVWESEFFVRSGFYTNRLRYRQIVDQAIAAGFSVVSMETGAWETLPTPRAKLALPFRDLPEEELLVRTLHLILTPARAARALAV